MNNLDEFKSTKSHIDGYVVVLCGIDVSKRISYLYGKSKYQLYPALT